MGAETNSQLISITTNNLPQLNTPTPKKRPWQIQSFWKPKKETRKHLNKTFYNSLIWRETRVNYIQELKSTIWDWATLHVITYPAYELELDERQSTYLLSLDFVPCEICLKLFAIGRHDHVNEGVELDHIYPLNPENALNSNGYGSPFDHNNLQLLCRSCHGRKSARDKRIIQLTNGHDHTRTNSISGDSSFNISK